MRIFGITSKSLADFSRSLDILKSLYVVPPTSFTFKKKADSFESTSEQVTRFLMDELLRSKVFPYLLILENLVELATHLRPFLKLKTPDV